MDLENVEEQGNQQGNAPVNPPVNPQGNQQGNQQGNPQFIDLSGPDHTLLQERNQQLQIANDRLTQVTQERNDANALVKSLMTKMNVTTLSELFKKIRSPQQERDVNIFLDEKNDALEAENAALKAEIATLKGENAALKAENADLRGAQSYQRDGSPALSETSEHSQYSQHADASKPDTVAPRVQVVKNIKAHFDKVNYVATRAEYEEALKEYGVKDEGDEAEDELPDLEGDVKKVETVSMAVPTQPWACWKEYSTEEQKTGFLYDILRRNGLLTKHVSWERVETEGGMDETKVEKKVREGLGMSGSLSIAGVCQFTVKVALAVVNDDMFLHCKNTQNNKYIFGTSSLKGKQETFVIDPLLKQIIDNIETKESQSFGTTAKRDNLSTSEVRSLFLEFTRLLGYIELKKKQLQDNRDPEMRLINDFIQVVTNIPKSKSPLDMMTPSVLFELTSVDGVNEIETVTADYFAGVGLAEFFPSLSETSIYVSEGAEKGGRPVSLPMKLLRGPAWVAFLVLILKMFDEEYETVQGNSFMTGFYNWKTDARVQLINQVLTSGGSANQNDNDGITYKEMKGVTTQGKKVTPFYDKCQEDSENFKRLASRLDIMVKHPLETGSMERDVSIYDLLMELGEDKTRYFTGNINIKLYRRAAFAGFCYQKSRRKVTLEMLTKGKRDYLGHDFNKIILALLMFSHGLTQQIHEWGYKKYNEQMKEEGNNFSDRIDKHFTSKENVLHYDNKDSKAVSDALEQDNLQWTSVLTDNEASEILASIAVTLQEDVKNKWDVRKNANNFGKTGSQLYREEYEQFCSPEGTHIDPQLVEQMFGNNFDVKSVGQKTLVEGLKDIIAIQSTINAHKYEAELPLFGNVCTFLGYQELDTVNEQLIDRGSGRCIFAKGNFFSDSASRQNRQLNSQLIQELTNKENIFIRNLSLSEDPDSVCVRSTDLHFSLAGQSAISVMNSVGCIDAASYRVHLEKGYSEIVLGGMVPLYLDDTKVCEVFLTIYEGKGYDKFSDYIFPSASLLVETDFWKLSQKNVVRVLNHMIDERFKDDVLKRLQDQMNEIIRITYFEDVKESAVNSNAVAAGEGSNANLSEVTAYQNNDKIKSEALRDMTYGRFSHFFASISDLFTHVTNTKDKFTSASFKESVGIMCRKLALDLDQDYTNTNGEGKDAINAWRFGECINEAINKISRYLQEPAKLFFQEESAISSRRSTRRGGAIEDTQSVLQISEPSSELFETPSLVENKQQLSTTNNIISSVTNPLETGYGLEKPTLQIYKHINAQGEIVFEPIMQLFGDGIYGGYLGFSNEKSFFKIFTSNQEVDEYIELHLPELQEYSEQKQLLLQDVPQVETPLTQLETPLTQVETPLETTTQYIPEKKPEEAPEEASGILSYLGLGGQNKSRRNRNRNKSRKARKTKRRIEKSNKRSRKHEKIINHTKTKSNH